MEYSNLFNLTLKTPGFVPAWISNQFTCVGFAVLIQVCFAGPTGAGFTPHLIFVKAGEV
jgi:hypothetical protein